MWCTSSDDTERIAMLRICVRRLVRDGCDGCCMLAFQEVRIAKTSTHCTNLCNLALSGSERLHLRVVRHTWWPRFVTVTPPPSPSLIFYLCAWWNRKRNAVDHKTTCAPLPFVDRRNQRLVLDFVRGWYDHECRPKQ